MYAASKRRHGQLQKRIKCHENSSSSEGAIKLAALGSKKQGLFLKRKIRNINDALNSDPVDVDFLRQLMITPEGSVTNDLRCKVWPKLLNINIFEYPRKKKADIELKEFQENKWWHQVNLDINRSHRRFPAGTRVSRRHVLQQQLTSVIMRVLCRNPQLSYYQGYHDIAVTLLRVVGEDLATALLDQLSKHHIRDFMDVTMSRTNRILAFFHPILAKVDSKLELFLEQAEVGTIFCLSWLITWFGHDVNGFDVIVRLFDLFLATHPVMPIYVSVALVRRQKEQVLKCECDMPMVHQCLSKLPLYVGMEDVEDLIAEAHSIYQKYPPDSLERAVRSYIRESTSIARHSELIYQSLQQRPDIILRRRKRLGSFLLETNSPITVNVSSGSAAKVSDARKLSEGFAHNPLVKVAVWTMTVSMGVMTFLVLNTSKYWL